MAQREPAEWEVPLGLGEEDRQQLRRIIGAFPKLTFAAGYGSGVVPQADATKLTKKPMKDFIFAVEDSRRWHEANIATNGGHYSGVAWLGSSVVARLQEDVGASIYYNTHVQLLDETIKYGVISSKHLISDLVNWDTLYVSGRMQKPGSDEIMSANQANLESALSSALLLAPAQLPQRQLWETIAGLSYTGDFRMQFGENPNKVKNIVTDKNAEAFRLMYRHSCDKLQHLLRLEDDTVVQDTSRAARQDLLLRLPARLKANVERQTGQSLVDLSGAPVQTIASAVASGISTLVKSSSRSQSLKAGLVKTIVYSANKIAKMRNATK
ncbi:Mitochondrial matrix Mmp37 protein, putative [Acanthamoeba castellanii str. Neff]|uniref:Phosphatidate cytidylyltransferase, mitochondrial n=1 Tax=Acanthamoeba castellanii (strain ATCC 30010 / Neff) TaxID=1257118 RepID=L8HEI0_ACACF|nr:Mitochondrial matrix Mmp37 protein, putative [Acanthamoeba castellanii str. Neff]ELR23570.1 Mitochondrial matrix Mmp37 protein, putative [Acanthamoeba castellanii str. Neff]